MQWCIRSRSPYLFNNMTFTSRKLNFRTVFLLVVLVEVIFVLLFICYKYTKVIDIINSIILFDTFIAILWYSWETQKLKEVTIKRPILTFIRKVVGSVVELELKNYGEGVARNVSIRLEESAKPIHTITLMSSILSASNSPLSIHSPILESWGKEIYIDYYNAEGVTKYTTIVKWVDSSINRDRCEIINYSFVKS